MSTDREKAQALMDRLTPEQLDSLLGCLNRQPNSTWHFNDCGCCVCVHPGGDPTRAYIIGDDGEFDYIDDARS